ncbi:MAG TPA: hypothetical protein VFS37_03645 [Conexibacter sp.]|nr:hypothetical protein [Conexibacter sp.]
MRHRCARLASIAVCVTAFTATTASADTQTFTTPGATTITLPAGVASVHVVAVGGRGGGLAGGFGAVVTGDVLIPRRPGPATPSQLRVVVGGNGAIGLAGVNRGGAAGPPADLGLATLAGGGGGASTIGTCRTRVDGTCAFRDALVAAGGGGAGADGLPGTGGAGGSAGVPGSPGSSTATLTAAGGGAAGVGDATAGAAGGAASSAGDDPPCEDGTAGRAGSLLGAGGAGGLSADLAGHGDGGGGGGGSRGGGAGGGGTYCLDDTGTSGGGGGGGASLLPTGGVLAADATGQPSVTITYEIAYPQVTIAAPVDGGVYAQRSVVRASFTCAMGPKSGARITSCSGTVPSGYRIGTATVGSHEFSVRAGDARGLSFTKTVHYDVTDQTPPRIRRLQIAPRTIDASQPGDFATISFRLKERARVRVVVQPVRSGQAARSRARIVAGHAGRNSFRLRARIGRRALTPGAYRLRLVATDRAGNRWRAEIRFSVVG